ncbi:hypothetical protein OC835_003383 [Tilletia horrida]|nr:hypothetical protein OC835_003383 [Tilletia horrida]
MASGSNTNVSGLSRRRPGGISSPTYGGNFDPEELGSPRTASPAPGNGHGHGHGNNSSARSSLGAAPVAFDPRDLQDENELSAHPRLTLMEEILLLGLKDRQGYLSFWNDSISFALRACIVIELALRKRIAVVREPTRRRFDVQDRLIEVINPKGTGEVLLDEALKMMRTSELMSTAQWVDLLSGETWNVMKIGYQLKQVRERLAKGLVDKGVLRTEKRNFLLFDMPTHPIADSSAKDGVLRRILMLLTATSPTVHAESFYREDDASAAGSRARAGGSRHRDEDLNFGGAGGSSRPAGSGSSSARGDAQTGAGNGIGIASQGVALRVTRALCLLCCSFSANVLENALTHLSYDARELAFQKADDVLADFAQWPMAPHTGGGGIGGAGPPGGGSGIPGASMGGSGATSNGRARSGISVGPGIAEGSVLPSSSSSAGRRPEINMGVGIEELARAIRAEYVAQGNEYQFEVIAGVLHVLSRMDSLL